MNRIKMLREAKGLGLREMALELKKQDMPLSWMTINKSEQPDSNPSWRTVRILSQYFGVSADYLMGTDMADAVHDGGDTKLPPELLLAVEKICKQQEIKQAH